MEKTVSLTKLDLINFAKNMIDSEKIINSAIFSDFPELILDENDILKIEQFSKENTKIRTIRFICEEFNVGLIPAKNFFEKNFNMCF